MTFIITPVFFLFVFTRYKITRLIFEIIYQSSDDQSIINVIPAKVDYELF